MKIPSRTRHVNSKDKIGVGVSIHQLLTCPREECEVSKVCDASKELTHSPWDSLVTLCEAQEGNLRNQEAPVAIHLGHSACLLCLHQNVGLGFGDLKAQLYGRESVT